MPDDNLNGADDTGRMLRDSATALMARHGGPGRVRLLRDQAPGYDRAVWAEMAEAGWFGLLVPEAAGGLGLGFAELAVLMEELGRALAPEPVGPAVVLAGGAILHGDGAVAKARLLPRLIDGSLIPALAWQTAEGAYGMDAGPAECRTGSDGARLHGTLRFIPSADGADGFLVAAPGEGIYWLDRDAAGLRVTRERRVDGGSMGTVILDGAIVGRDETVASGPVAVVALARAIDEARLAASAELLGVMAQALEITVGFVKERVQFGRPIGSFQALQHRIVDLWVQVELARSAVQHAAAVFDRSDDPTSRGIAVCAAKARCSDAALLVTREAIQLHGGMGYTDEADIGLFLKRALVLSAWLGNSRAMRQRFAALSAMA